MHGMQNIKSIRIGVVGIMWYRRSIKIPGICYGKGIYDHVDFIYLIKIHITAKSSIIAIDATAIIGIELSVIGIDR
jgi:hypothetical protein